MFADGTLRSGSVPLVLPVKLLSMVRSEVVTVVSATQFASWTSLFGWQLLPGPVTTTTFGRSVVPVGNESSSVTEKVSVTDPPFAAIVGIVHVSVPAAKLQPRLQSALYVAWARTAAMSSEPGTLVASAFPVFGRVIG